MTFSRPSGLTTNPQSCAQTNRLTRTYPVCRLTSTSAIVATIVLLPPALGAEIPRPVTTGPLPRGVGEGRVSQPYLSAAALGTALARVRAGVPFDGRYF